MMNDKWICDIRSGCVAVYFGEKRTCLSGANEWAVFHATGKYNSADGYWTLESWKAILGKLIAWWLNLFRVKGQ